MRGLNVRKLEICSEIGRWALFAFKKPSLMLCRIVLYVVYGVALMWIGVVWIPVGASGVS
jgi:hypothetical protein